MNHAKVVLLVMIAVAILCLSQHPGGHWRIKAGVHPLPSPAAIPAYVISVPNTRPRDVIKKRFEGKLSNVQIFDGVDGRRVQSTSKLLPGQLGCAMSHISLWRHLLRTGAPAGLVFEDDADPLPDFQDRLGAILKYIDGSIDMVFVGHCGERTDGKPRGPGLRESVHPRCTHGYLVTRQGIEKLVRWAKTAELQGPIDELLAKMIYNHKLRAVSCIPPIVGTTDDASIIWTMGKKAADA